MRFSLKTFLLLTAGAALAGCGGGGGDSHGGFTPPQSGTLSLTPTTTSLPRNPNNVAPYPGSPFMAEVLVGFRNAAGTLTAPNGDATVTTSSPSVISVSPPDDPATTEINEMAQRMVTFPLKLNNGSNTFFATSYDVAGSAEVIVSAVDPNTNRTTSKSVTFTVAGATPLPASVAVAANPYSVYVPGSAGSSSSVLTAVVRDGANQFVPNPGATDNVKFEIVGNGGGASLSASSAGGAVSGTSVTTRTINGIATASFQAGTLQGPIQIRATADRADNNVGNGISDPVSSTNTIIVSDGNLHSVVLSVPDSDAITINAVAPGVAPTTPTSVPVDPNGTYSLTVTAQAQDRQGAPVLAGTPLQFGVVDSPMAGFPAQGRGTFAIRGTDGNPQEGGTLFTSNSAHFRTAAERPGPGDTLLVFGQESAGNVDLEGARIVASVPTDTSLTVTSPFNRNDTTGSSVDFGPVLRYVVGRALEASITGSATTDQLGQAQVQLTYPVARLGKAAYIYVQGNAGIVNGGPKLVADTFDSGFAGVAPAVLKVAPNPIPGNTANVSVTVCYVDALDSGLQGVTIGFAFQGVNGSASMDGQSNAGFLTRPTGVNGCTSGLLTTTGVGATGSSIRFTAGTSATTSIPLVAPSALVLQATPSTVVGSGGTVTLRLTDGSGVGIPGVVISGNCSVSAQLTGAIAPTGANGQTTAQINILNQYGNAVTGACQFSAAGGTPNATVNIQGYDLCTTDPSNSACSDTQPEAPVRLTVFLNRGTSGYAGSVTVVSTPAGVSCQLATGGQQATSCIGSFTKGIGVVLNGTLSAAGNLTWSGACANLGGNAGSVTLAADATCTATVGP